jgi:hypothetical protein
MLDISQQRADYSAKTPVAAPTILPRPLGSANPLKMAFGLPRRADLLVEIRCYAER